MKLGILSDTHNQRDRCREAVSLLQAAGVDAIVHCGDFTEPDILELCAVRPCYFVLGNNDADNAQLLQQTAEAVNAKFLEWGGVITLAGKTIAVTHGHLTAQVRRLMAQQPDYLLSGHTHVADDRCIDHTRRINPGALHRARHFTVATLDLLTDELTFLDVPR
ncbi:MAG TPA: metallophosphoesterase family protein [Planctomycetaceae bacterium]|jgi:putative phosphoesterase|nr:metallophosphoesterase family protein [Planctomycetaceae bacterium]